MPDIGAGDDGNLVVTLNEQDVISVFLQASTVEFRFTGNSVSLRLHSLEHPRFEDWVTLDLDAYRAS